MHGSTKRAGHDFLDSLQKWTRTDCGYAAVKNVASLELDDTMPSFFLAETVKYLYLLFDDDNFIHRRPYIFTTEAHPFLRNPTGGLQKRQQTPLPPLPASASPGQLSGKGTEEPGHGSDQDCIEMIAKHLHGEVGLGRTAAQQRAQGGGVPPGDAGHREERRGGTR